MTPVALLVCLLLTPAQDEIIRVGQDNWEKPWVPDLRKADAKIEIAAERRIDVLILGDGYLASERADFENDVREWYDRFITTTPWSQFRGAFRVRGLWTPSEARATPERKSAYRLAATATGVGDVTQSKLADTIFASLDKAGVNRAVTRSRLSHVVPVLLVRNEQGRNPSGLTRLLTSSDAKASVAVAFAAYTHHEFGHAFGGLRDEYISLTSEKSPPRSAGKPNLFTLSNVTSTKDPAQLAWSHLLPGGPLNPAKESVIGLLWIGGGLEEGVWHSEARCLMNGTHDNWDLQKTKRGLNLRDMNRFCFWCEELLVARTLQKTGQLGNSEDGESLWKRWTGEFRPFYQKSFDVAGRLKAKNEENAKAKLAEAKIYEHPSGN
jgi:hypothetical protein